jgi:hypothetical protein
MNLSLGMWHQPTWVVSSADGWVDQAAGACPVPLASSLAQGVMVTSQPRASSSARWCLILRLAWACLS